jgi:hypothetical protein
MPTIIKKTRVEMRELPPREHTPRRGGPCSETNEKKAELVLDHDRVVALEFTCSCGERTVITLEYDDRTTPRTLEEA